MSIDKPTGQRGSWLYKDGKLVPFERKKKVVNAPFVHKDEVDAFENPVRGTMETSMSTYRRHLKEDGYFEKGNERLQYKPPSRDERYAEVLEAKREAERQVKYGMAKFTPEEREIWNTKSEAERLEKMEKMMNDPKRTKI